MICVAADSQADLQGDGLQGWIEIPAPPFPVINARNGSRDEATKLHPHREVAVAVSKK